MQAHGWPGHLNGLSGYARLFALGLFDFAANPSRIKGQCSLQHIVAGCERTLGGKVLQACRGDMARLKELLQIVRKTIYDKLARYEFKSASVRKAGVSRTAALRSRCEPLGFALSSFLH